MYNTQKADQLLSRKHVKRMLRLSEMYTAASGGFTKNGMYKKTCPSNVFEIR